MALYLLKPILWNKAKYKGPSGVKAAADSYPGKFGFGHEEWNNSDRMEFSENGQRYRVFHTEGIKKAPVHEHQGTVFVLMIASHDGIQQLVGVAGNAMYLGNDEYKNERRRIAKLLNLKNLREDVWKLPTVRKRFDDDWKKFSGSFSRDVNWVPNWICPAGSFFWLDEPVTLDPKCITGSTALPRMFSGYQPLERVAANIVMNSVPIPQRTPAWHCVLDGMASASDDPVALPENTKDRRATARLTMINARIGQGSFRNELMMKWNNACAATGLTCPELLRASHVKPWAAASEIERLDPDNGLLLSAHLDALFDKGIISFDAYGKMLISPRLGPAEQKHFNLPNDLLKAPNLALRKYLAYHRQELFKRSALE